MPRIAGLGSPNGVDAAAWGTAAWAAAGWPTLDNWLGWGDATYYPYDYGDNITYDGDNVYYNSQPAGTAEQYYQEASNLAATTSSTASEATAEIGSRWAFLDSSKATAKHRHARFRSP